MKRLMIVAVAFLLSCSLKAQDKMEAKPDSKMAQPAMKDHVMMKDGKMMMMKDGKMMAMDQDMTMSNGTMVMMDGTVKMKDGKTMMMKDGESMAMDGKMMHKPMKKKMADSKM